MQMMRNKQRGFTLVELSIVLVIIGLIIGGVLTGQQIIQNARITNALNAIQAYESQFQTYAQNYGALPGDDSSALSRFPNAPGIVNGNGNGTVDGAFDVSCAGAPTTESCLVWADLRAAGLVKNQVPVFVQPANSFNGIYGFENGSLTSGTNAFPASATLLCMNNIPAAAAEAIDARLDDGASSTGSVRALDTTGAIVTSYGALQTYTLCMQM